ncbi:hypothetical protein IAU59_001715 [Kwoniella sp. CBS 9459]
MDLATVKAAVKSWEKSFRLREGRDPTKDDIKRDTGDIAKQYALYRKLSKPSSSSSQSQSQSGASSSRSRPHRPSLPPSTSTSSSSASISQTNITPRHVPSSEYPTTPTPPSRRSSSNVGRSNSSTSQSQSQAQAGSNVSRSKSQAGPSGSSSAVSRNIDHVQGNGSRTDDPKKALKRKASKSAFNRSDPRSSSSPHPPLPDIGSASASASSSRQDNELTTSTSSARTLFSTPKKAYTGPVHDPNPVNPFTITTPTKSSPFNSGLLNGSGSGGSALKHTNSFESPFIHASSPRKLKEVLEANSLQRVKERTMNMSATKNEVTPRTRARKRLRGEPVEDTPMKDKLPRRRRGHGQAQGSSTTSAAPAGQVLLSDDVGFLSIPEEKDVGAFDDLDEDELGPSPMKGLTAGVGKGFTSLFGQVEAETSGSRESKKGPVSRNSQSDDARESISARNEMRRRGRPSEMMGLFGRLGKSTIQRKAPDLQLEDDEKGIRNAHKDDPVSPTPAVLGEASTTASIRIEVQASPSPSPAPLPFSTDHPNDNHSLGTAQNLPLDTVDAGSALQEPHSPDPGPNPERTPPASQLRRKMISLSDDEADEWDPEGGHVRRQVLIVPTRRQVRRRDSDSSDLGMRPAQGANNAIDNDDGKGGHGKVEDEDAVEEEKEDQEGEQREEAISSLGSEDGNGPTSDATMAIPNGVSSTRSPSRSQTNGQLSLPMLNLLSLRSPSKTKAGQTRARLEELRVKALFDPTAQTRLKAMQRGQEIVFTGESRGVDDDEEDEDGILEKYEFGLKERRAYDIEQEEGDAAELEIGEGEGEGEGEGDDDWEEESDGWKREQVDEDW